jgi:hypothetical protein
MLTFYYFFAIDKQDNRVANKADKHKTVPAHKIGSLAKFKGLHNPKMMSLLS